MDIHKILEKKFSNRIYSCRGDSSDYTIEWLDGGTKHKNSTVEAKWSEVQAEEAAEKYKQDRQSEYPTIEEMTIAMWEKDVEGRPEAANKLEQKRQEIKNKFPKPS